MFGCRPPVIYSYTAVKLGYNTSNIFIVSQVHKLFTTNFLPLNFIMYYLWFCNQNRCVFFTCLWKTGLAAYEMALQEFRLQWRIKRTFFTKNRFTLGWLIDRWPLKFSLISSRYHHQAYQCSECRIKICLNFGVVNIIISTQGYNLSI